MTDNLNTARNFLKKENIDYLLVNSTNEYLVEYNVLEENSRYHLTGFSGSTGEAILSFDKLWLFVDGRYHIQADLEINHDITDVVKLELGDNLYEKMSEIIEPNTVIGVISKKNSQAKLETLKKTFKSKNISIKLLNEEWLNTSVTVKNKEFTEIPVNLTGSTSQEKINKLTAKLTTDEAILITDLEDVSYFFNLRDFSKTNSCSINAKALLTNDSATLITTDLKNYITNDIKTVYADKNTTNAYDYAILGNKAKEIAPIYNKSIKTEEEIEHYKDAFNRSDKALSETREYILNNDNISEYDIAKYLEEAFKRNGAKSLSFVSIVAKDKNSALAHYSKSSKDEFVKEGSLVLIDCGGYFDGGLATDMTRVFVKGEASFEQKSVYTCVLKAFLKAFNTELKENICGYDIDKIARDYLNEISPAGYVFSHGLGHGIGISVHEYPPKLANVEISKYPIKTNMCFTIEPGLYKKDSFGIRLENSCYAKNGKIYSFSNMCYEKKLINYDMLSEEETNRFSIFEVK